MRVVALLVLHVGSVAEIYKLRDILHASQRHPSSVVFNIQSGPSNKLPQAQHDLNVSVTPVLIKVLQF